MKLRNKHPIYLFLGVYLSGVILGEGMPSSFLQRISFTSCALAGSVPERSIGKIGYLGLLPMPPNYPFGYQVNERCFTSELYSRDPAAELSSSDLLFIPKDYKAIFNSSFLQTLQYSGINIRMYPSKIEALSDGVQAIIMAFPAGFHVMRGNKAVVEISYKIYRMSDDSLIWGDVVKTELDHDQLPDLLPEKTLVFMIGNHQFNFQPQRSFLAYGTNRNAMELVKALRTKVNSAREN